MTTSPQSTSLEIVPDFAQLLSDGFPVDIVRLRYTVSYNFSVTSNLFELLPGVNRDLHCSNDIIAEEIINLRAATFPVVGDSYGFQRSGLCRHRHVTCTCTIASCYMYMYMHNSIMLHVHA